MTEHKCRECRYLTGQKTEHGTECLEPRNQWKWSGKRYRKSAARYKQPSRPACTKFQPRTGGE